MQHNVFSWSLNWWFSAWPRVSVSWHKRQDTQLILLLLFSGSIVWLFWQVTCLVIRGSVPSKFLSLPPWRPFISCQTTRICASAEPLRLRAADLRQELPLTECSQQTVSLTLYAKCHMGLSGNTAKESSKKWQMICKGCRIRRLGQVKVCCHSNTTFCSQYFGCNFYEG